MDDWSKYRVYFVVWVSGVSERNDYGNKLLSINMPFRNCVTGYIAIIIALPVWLF